MFENNYKHLRYTETNKQSNDISRRAIPQISKYNLAANPINYTIWYEYYRSSNLQLKKAVNKYIKQGKTITNELMESLYDTYISVLDVQAVKQAQDRVIYMIYDFLEGTLTLDSSASNKQQYHLAKGDQFESSAVNQASSNVMCKLIAENNTLQFSLQTLGKQFDESQRQINELHKKLELAKAETLRDDLTGLANRKGFLIAFKKSLVQYQETDFSISLLMIDIDYLKKINDTHGHLIGDKVIKFIAETLISKIKGQDTASRFGGEEFAVLLPNTALHGAQVIAEDIRKNVNKAYLCSSQNQPIGQITISIGISSYQPNESFESFIGRADEVLYVSKQTGRDRVTVYNSES